MTIKEILEGLITARGVSAREVARNVGISYQPIYAILSGKTTRPQGKTVKALADYFGVTPAQLLGKEPLGGREDEFEKMLRPFDEAFYALLGPGVGEGVTAGETAKENSGGSRRGEGAADDKRLGEESSETALMLRQFLIKKYVRGETLVIPVAGLGTNDVSKILRVLVDVEIKEVLAKKAGNN